MDIESFLSKSSIPRVIRKSPITQEEIVSTITSKYKHRSHLMPLEISQEIQNLWPSGINDTQALRQQLLKVISKNDRPVGIISTEKQGLSKNESKVILINSMPRAGNSLLNQIISRIYDMESSTAHRINHVFGQSEKGIVVQVHATPNADHDRFLRDQNANLVTILRHPLDVAISMLHFSNFEPQTKYWIDGHQVKAHKLIGLDPQSKKFKKWLLSDSFGGVIRAAQDLWERENIARIRFEDLIANPHKSIHKLTRDLKDLEKKSVDEIRHVTDEIILTSFAGAKNMHRWRGRVDTWRRYFDEDTAEKVYSKYGHTIELLGYNVQGPFVTKEEALHNWQKDF